MASAVRGVSPGRTAHCPMPGRWTAPRHRVWLLVATGLMCTGVAPVGAVVGTFSSWLVRRFRQEGEE
ncbi:hypothetical protein [Streptomyces sp. NPDC059080]|uniref:hypothetical protein n=1 Tax=Streptomyces sp. NPDC059080 TaxID=3346718 RepID=UPI0036A85012